MCLVISDYIIVLLTGCDVRVLCFFMYLCFTCESTVHRCFAVQSRWEPSESWDTCGVKHRMLVSLWSEQQGVWPATISTLNTC